MREFRGEGGRGNFEKWKRNVGQMMREFWEEEEGVPSSEEEGKRKIPPS